MHYVYVLRSNKKPKCIYKGCTTNLAKRIQTHNAGLVKHTSKYKPWKLEFYICFKDQTMAYNFEKYLKTASGIAFMRKRLLSP